MDGAHGEVEAFEDAFREVERAVFEDIHLSALEKNDAIERFVEPIDRANLASEPLRVEAMRNREAPAVIGDGHVLVAARAGGFRQTLQRVMPIARVRVAVEVAANLLQGDQAR